MRHLLFVLALALLAAPTFADAQGKHLFILSGQSNMAGMDPDLTFTPTVYEALGKDHVIVVKYALGAAPIRHWYKKWKPAEGEQPEGHKAWIYDRLIRKVNKAIKDQTIVSVTFIWMQGERDAKEKHGEVYAVSMRGVIDQLAGDLQREHINFVIGRLSDFDLNNERYAHWTMVRDAQVKVAEDDDRGDWVDTDDLNDGLNKKGKAIKNDLHYSVQGYKTLGKRFAEKAIALIKE